MIKNERIIEKYGKLHLDNKNINNNKKDMEK